MSKEGKLRRKLRERDLDDLRCLIGTRNLERCRTPACDRYILRVEQGSCPHCAVRSLDRLRGRAGVFIHLMEDGCICLSAGFSPQHEDHCPARTP